MRRKREILRLSPTEKDGSATMPYSLESSTTAAILDAEFTTPDASIPDTAVEDYERRHKFDQAARGVFKEIHDDRRVHILRKRE